MLVPNVRQPAISTCGTRVRLPNASTSALAQNCMLLYVRLDVLRTVDGNYICSCHVVIEVILFENADNSVKSH